MFHYFAILKKEQDIEASEWNDLIRKFPDAHILQTWNWGQVKSKYGWLPEPVLLKDQSGAVMAAALVLSRQLRIKRLTFPFRVLYIPRGPLLDWGNPSVRNQVFTSLEHWAKRQGVIFVKIDPDLIVGWGIPGSIDARENPIGRKVEEELVTRGWKFSQDQIQFRNTILIDLREDEDQWLARMKPKWRYNLRLAMKKGVRVRPAKEEDLPWMYQTYAETSLRDGFIIRSREYYFHLWKKFIQENLAEGLIAEVDGTPVAGLIQFRFGGKAWYFYGMSGNLHREKMPNYLLQWKSMQVAKEAGCTWYDLWGAPDIFDEEDQMNGVFRFKIGMGGTVVRTIGAWDYTTRPQWYHLYTRVLPAILNLMRKRRKENTRQEVNL